MHKPRARHRLTDLMLPKLKPGKIRESGKKMGQHAPRAYPDGDGLYFVVSGPTSRHWLFRFKINKTERVMGLGSYPEVTLAEAREKADAARKIKKAGDDPITMRQAERRAEQEQIASLEAEAEAKRRTVKVVLKLWYELNEKRWTNVKYRDDVWSAFERYAIPVIGDIPVDEAEPDDIMRVVEPHWDTKRETMARLRTNIAAAFSMAKAKKWRKGDNPAAWADNLEHMLTKRSRGDEAEHFPAMPYTQVPAFMAKLRETDLISARALEFTILNASRTMETAGMRWPEVKRETALWIVPPARIKSRRPHTVLLCDRSIQILKEMEALHKDYVFPDRTNEGHMSDGSMLQLLDRLGYGAFTVHGFRSSFKDWCREMTSFPDEASEISLAHKVGDDTRRAYARGALLAKRRKMMEAWSNYCCRQEQGNVVELHQSKSKAATK